METHTQRRLESIKVIDIDNRESGDDTAFKVNCVD